MNDEKTAADYKVSGGSVLHLVLCSPRGSLTCPTSSTGTPLLGTPYRRALMS